ncbi:hypothetical protein A2627_00130 [Candidatus Woesebacteria bacterium RIFCSPHIGHO2_01_FULL_39_28]|uniref:Type II secretion system protein GspG C-terminal domain-containing protein n=1 Tax=Candidatus Woesebacteria bacterium RIFCSPHIGHO2_01_FULL_39_28 TaxID=1802496 RepID=A0A1F7YCY9_9BACT|nr:MAG: hypothetical protein A2627_00130 [Candidatus Woesebacteria bacterium RIFCSPHIGHO2_01_FULL_39_28]OGM57878.1 MAG: hypothetical protein A3A50_04560 [Candidatus Woesebacteria bacterium RIFCSPLOWO2_01_FULL_38_20]
MRKFLGLSRDEAVGIIVILCLVFLASFINLRKAVMRSRDNQRKADIKNIAAALDKYNKDFGKLPLSKNGFILACEPVDVVGLTIEYSPCKWGKDALRDLSDLTYPPYLSSLPIDPQYNSGFNYLYISNGTRFQIYASLEGVGDDEYNAKILARNLACGIKICDFGIALGDTPLDKSIQEYENELIQKSK